MFPAKWNFLTGSEADRSRACIEELTEANTASALTKAINKNGGVEAKNARPLLFEARFAVELLHKNITPHYEYPGGIDDDRIDFKFSDDPSWLVELVSIDETDVLSKMTTIENIAEENAPEIAARFLEIRSDAEDARHTGAWQMIKMQEKILCKVRQNDLPHKFPPAEDNVVHSILISTKGYNGGSGADIYDLNQLVFGIKYAHEVFNEWFKGQPVRGIFDETNDDPAAVLMQERIHCLIFVCEQEYGPGTMWKKAFVFWNPFLEFDAEKWTESFPWTVHHKFRIPSKSSRKPVTPDKV